MTHSVFVGINTFLAIVAAVAAFGSLNKMHWKSTRPCLVVAMVLIGIGLAGQAIGLLKEEWASYADTALYGGVLALIIASQRVHTWFLERWANPIATMIGTVIAGLFLIGLLSGCAPAPVAPPSMSQDIPVHVFERDGLVVRLMRSPCIDAVAKQMAATLPKHADKFRAIDSTWPMQDGSRRNYGGCWAELPGEEVGAPVAVVFVLLFEDRSAFVLDKEDFLKKPGV